MSGNNQKTDLAFLFVPALTARTINGFLHVSEQSAKQSMIFQIAEVNKQLGAVSYFVDQDYRVVYDKNMVTGEDMSYMIHKPTKTSYRFRRERNIWILDAIVNTADLFGDFSRPE